MPPKREPRPLPRRRARLPRVRAMPR
jgi:hypothetical protein